MQYHPKFWLSNHSVVSVKKFVTVIRAVARIFFSTEAKRTTAGPKSEACRAEIGDWVLGNGQLIPFPPASGSGERCMLPQRGPGGAAKRFSRVLSVQNGLSIQFSVVYCSLNFTQATFATQELWTLRHW